MMLYAKSIHVKFEVLPKEGGIIYWVMIEIPSNHPPQRTRGGWWLEEKALQKNSLIATVLAAAKSEIFVVKAGVEIATAKPPQ